MPFLGRIDSVTVSAEFDYESVPTTPHQTTPHQTTAPGEQVADFVAADCGETALGGDGESEEAAAENVIYADVSGILDLGLILLILLILTVSRGFLCSNSAFSCRVVCLA